MHIADPDFALPKALRLADDEVHLWRVDLATVGPAEARWLPLLSEDEAKRAARFHFDRDRQRYVAARAWLRRLLGAYLEFEAKELTFSYSAKEKPALGFSYGGQRMEFNVSHSGAVALLAFALGRQAGVDVEAVRARARRDIGVPAGGEACRVLPLLDSQGGLYQGHRRRFVAASKPVRRLHCRGRNECPAGHPA